MSDKYQLSPPSTVFEAGIKSLPDKGFRVSSWPGYTTHLYLHTACYLSRNPEIIIHKALKANLTRELSLSNQDKVENAISALSAVLKKPW
jgi:hypothetical protein